MSINLLKDKGAALDRQRFTWKDMVGKPISKLDDDAFTRVRVVLMNGIESDSIRTKQTALRMNLPLREKLAQLMRAEQHQQTCINWLLEHNVHIWDEWADENGDLGPVYGVQWRSWPAPTPEDPNRTIDQISNVLDLIKHHPDSRRMIVSAWNPAEVEKMALPPCHALFQFYVADGKLSCQLYQRSCDMFLGVPFNIASYSLLTMMMAQQTGLKPGEFVWTGGDCHVYDNHVDQFLEQLGRKPYPYPTIEIRKADSLFDYQYEDFKVVGYQHHPTIKAPVAV